MGWNLRIFMCIYVYVSHYLHLTLLMLFDVILAVNEMKQAGAFHANLKL